MANRVSSKIYQSMWRQRNLSQFRLRSFLPSRMEIILSPTSFSGYVLLTVFSTQKSSAGIGTQILLNTKSEQSL